MKAPNFSDAQNAEQGRTESPVAEICRGADSSASRPASTGSRIRRRLPTEMKRLKQNGKLRKLVADLSVDKSMLT
ncbi:MAG: hypothetical protein EOQ92_24520 [Mesorhizobium sp.]|uniref:hypothetical protein n=1 Tax=Mesorhizobium sp. TaxID=1871066 RepID=UPI000FE9D7AE|nr:hypothetical protein [Mesorhizobium sp.]RWF93303.1 MAG: hypothetical protein EOQ45_17115 [Mesorhizobium sp.]RWI17157.1 MAG: hypothetical protein EOQ92_24520 [Mesorhizobium sp.]TIU80530.1 MAG: hypothetical protein E5W13_02875 [Mesorhizobium sp.]